MTKLLLSGLFSLLFWATSAYSSEIAGHSSETEETFKNLTDRAPLPGTAPSRKDESTSLKNEEEYVHCLQTKEILSPQITKGIYYFMTNPLHHFMTSPSACSIEDDLAEKITSLIQTLQRLSEITDYVLWEKNHPLLKEIPACNKDARFNVLARQLYEQEQFEEQRQLLPLAIGTLAIVTATPETRQSTALQAMQIIHIISELSSSSPGRTSCADLKEKIRTHYGNKNPYYREGGH
jgi:hypothetical protein